MTQNKKDEGCCWFKVSAWRHLTNLFAVIGVSLPSRHHPSSGSPLPVSHFIIFKSVHTQERGDVYSTLSSWEPPREVGRRDGWTSLCKLLNSELGKWTIFTGNLHLLFWHTWIPLEFVNSHNPYLLTMKCWQNPQMICGSRIGLV